MWPENTIEAFEGALDLGYRYLETDLHRTRDGGNVRDYSLAELRRLDPGHRFSPDGGRTFPYRGKGCRIPTLEEALALHPRLRLNVEIKQRQPPMEAALWDEIERLDAADRLLVAAGHDALVHRFRALGGARWMPTSPGIRGVQRFWLGVQSGLHRFERYPFDALQVPATHAGLPVVTEAFVAAAHRRSIRVHVWTVDEAAEMDRLLDLGVDGIMTDQPAVLREVFERRGLWTEDASI